MLFNGELQWGGWIPSLFLVFHGVYTLFQLENTWFLYFRNMLCNHHLHSHCLHFQKALASPVYLPCKTLMSCFLPTSFEWLLVGEIRLLIWMFPCWIFPSAFTENKTNALSKKCHMFAHYKLWIKSCILKYIIAVTLACSLYLVSPPKNIFLLHCAYAVIHPTALLVYQRHLMPKCGVTVRYNREISVFPTIWHWHRLMKWQEVWKITWYQITWHCHLQT